MKYWKIFTSLFAALAVSSGIGTAVAIACTHTSKTTQICDDEKFLVKTADQKGVPYYKDLTIWMCNNRINPNIDHESLAKFEEGYANFSKTHPLSHSYEAYLDFVKDNMKSEKNSMMLQGQDSSLTTSITKIHTLPIKYSSATVNPDSLVTIIDTIFSQLETTYPDYAAQMQVLNTIIDTTITGGWQDNVTVEKIVDSTFEVIEQYTPASYKNDLYVLNTSIDVIIMSNYSQNEIIKQVNGIIDNAIAKATWLTPQTINTIKAFETCLDTLISYIAPPSPEPVPPTPGPVIIVIENLINGILNQYAQNSPEFCQCIKTILYSVLEADWRNADSVVYALNNIFNALNTLIPSYGIGWFVLNNAIDLIIENNFERVTTNKQLDGLIDIAITDYPQFSAQLTTLRKVVDTICASQFSYDAAIAMIKLYISNEIGKIRQSEYTAEMVMFFCRVAVDIMIPSTELWWYGQGGDYAHPGDGYYGYKLQNKVQYSSNFAWTEIKAGDTIYEEAGVDYLGGHSGMIDGVYYDIAHNELYVKGVEGYSPAGVETSVWDEARMKARDTHFAHVKDASVSVSENAVNYAYSQLGHKYAVSMQDRPSSEEIADNSASWYCSELVNYSYLQAGDDLSGYKFVDRYKTSNRDLDVALALYDDLGFLDGDKDFHSIPGDLNVLDIPAIGAGMITPREINSSPKTVDYIAPRSL